MPQHHSKRTPRYPFAKSDKANKFLGINFSSLAVPDDTICEGLFVEATLLRGGKKSPTISIYLSLILFIYYYYLLLTKKQIMGYLFPNASMATVWLDSSAEAEA